LSKTASRREPAAPSSAPWATATLDRFLALAARLLDEDKATADLGFLRLAPALRYSSYDCIPPLNSVNFLQEGGHHEWQLLDSGEGYGDHSPVVTSLISGGENTVTAPNLRSFLEIGTRYGFACALYRPPEPGALVSCQSDISPAGLDVGRRISEELQLGDPGGPEAVARCIAEAHRRFSGQMKPPYAN